MSDMHLKAPMRAVTICGVGDAGTATEAECQTYGVGYCAGCSYLWRRELRDARVDVALLDCLRHEGRTLDDLAPTQRRNALNFNWKGEPAPTVALA